MTEVPISIVTPQPERCISCRFWTAPGTGVLGLCRRFPASERKEAQDWCGCWESAQAGERPETKGKRGRR